MEENEKNNIWKSVVLIILLIIVLIVVFIAKNVLTKKDEKKAKTSNNTQNVQTMNNTNIGVVSGNLIKIIDNQMLYILTQNTNINSLVQNNNLTEDEIKIMYFYLKENNRQVTKENVDEYTNNLYGITLSEYPDITVNGVTLYTFNKETNEYTPTNTGSDVAYFKPILIKNYKITKDENNYEITVNMLYPPVQDIIATPEYAYYADGSFKTKIPELDKTADQINDKIQNSYDQANTKAINYYKNNYNKLKEVGLRYKFTFRKDESNYYLISYQVIS